MVPRRRVIRKGGMAVRPEALVTAVRRYRVMAYVTGVVLMVLCFVGIPLQVFAHNLVVVNYVGTTHGILYLIYLGAAPLHQSRAGRRRDGSRALSRPAGPRAVGVSQQYFAEHPAARPRPGLVHVVTPDLHLELETDSGVFSPARLDAGTRLLLETAPQPPATGEAGQGDLLARGCGYAPRALA